MNSSSWTLLLALLPALAGLLLGLRIHRFVAALLRGAARRRYRESAMGRGGLVLLSLFFPCAVSLLGGWVWGMGPDALAVGLLAAPLVAAVLSDLVTRRVPEEVLAIAVGVSALWVAVAAGAGGLLERAVVAVVVVAGFGLLAAVASLAAGRWAFGAADLWMIATFALVVGLGPTISALVHAAVLASVGIALRCRRDAASVGIAALLVALLVAAVLTGNEAMLLGAWSLPLLWTLVRLRGAPKRVVQRRSPLVPALVGGLALVLISRVVAFDVQLPLGPMRGPPDGFVFLTQD